MVTYLNRVFSVTLPDTKTVDHLNVTWAEEFAKSAKGPVKGSFLGVQDDPVLKAWVEAFESMGHPLTASPFSGNSTGPYNAPSSVNPATKTRSYSGNSYYAPVADRSNLVVFTKAVATRILLSGPEHVATGVEFIQDSTTKTVKAKNEIILSAGVFNSPKLLELSGIGDPDVLSAAGVDLKVSSPYVGTNLQDHILSGISFEVQDGIPTKDDLMRKDPEAVKQAGTQYQEHKTGPLASTGVTAFGYLPIVDFVSDTQARDAFFQSLSKVEEDHPLDKARIDQLRNLVQDGQEGTGQFFVYSVQAGPAGIDRTSGNIPDPLPENYITLVSALSHPLSTGTVHITSSDVSTPPTLDHRYLSSPIDLELHARNIRYLENIAAAAPFATILKPNGRRNDPRSKFEGEDSLQKAKEYVKLASSTNYHSVGTCAMAPQDKGGVVDHNLRVYGVKGLRVVDASVFPLVPQSNTQSLVYVVAERASELIAQSWSEA